MEAGKIILGNFKQSCTGCATCQNVCPRNAIAMKEAENTFRYPYIDNSKCVDCGLCVRTCPVNQYTNNNSSSPVIIAAHGDDELRRNSSSGGMFSIYASAVLEKQGTVYCVEIDNNQQVKHIRIDNVAELHRGRGSKYVQSDVGTIYRQVKEDLIDGRYVLFTGCPCQVAGLNNFLGQRFDRLFTIDIICHGVPSQKLFDMYLQEKRVDTIKNVEFRTKKYGWRADVMTIVYDNEPTYAFSDKQGDSYEIGFQKNIILRDSCERCKFSEFPRIGDITIGDFWGIQKYLPNDNKGISLVLLNNKHGASLHALVNDKLELNQQLSIPINGLPNRLFNYYPHHINKKLFFEHIKTKPFSKAISLAENGIYDVGIVGIPTVENFGGSLTYVALYNVVKEFKLSCLMIERPLSAPHPPANIFFDYHVSPFEDGALINNCKNKNDLFELNNRVLSFLIGSDQLFHHNLYNNFGKICTLDWVSDYKKKVAYAASFGHDIFTGSEKERAEMAYYMQKFDAFSVRESSGVALAKNEFGVDAIQVLDPVFLCNKDVYTKMLSHAKNRYEYPHIASYILDPNSEKADMLQYVEKYMGLPIKVFSEMHYNNTTIKNKWDREIEVGKIEDRLSNIANCELMVTDSFHGVCFAIIFKKKFIAVKNKGRGVARFETILALAGLSNRLISQNANLAEREDLFDDIDYVEVYRRLNPEIKKCKDWLYSNLIAEKKKAYSSYDALFERHKNDYRHLEEKINRIERFLLQGFTIEDDLEKYLKKLFVAYSDTDNLAVIIAAKDTPGMAINEKIVNYLRMFNYESDFLNMHWYGYIGISYRSKAIELKEYDKSVSYQTVIQGNNIDIISSPLHDGNKAIIAINGIDYSMNNRGLNIVVLDTKSGTIMDSVSFDTHALGFKCNRR